MNHYAYEQGFKQRYAQLEKQAMDPRLAYGLGGALGGGALGFFTAPEGHGLRNALIGAGLGGAAGAGVGQYMMPGESPEKALAGINAPLPAGAVKIPEHPYKVKPLPPVLDIPRPSSKPTAALAPAKPNTALQDAAVARIVAFQAGHPYTALNGASVDPLLTPPNKYDPEYMDLEKRIREETIRAMAGGQWDSAHKQWSRNMSAEDLARMAYRGYLGGP